MERGFREGWEVAMLMTIPISAARDIAEKYGYEQVIIRL